MPLISPDLKKLCSILSVSLSFAILATGLYGQDASQYSGNSAYNLSYQPNSLSLFSQTAYLSKCGVTGSGCTPVVPSYGGSANGSSGSASGGAGTPYDSTDPQSGGMSAQNGGTGSTGALPSTSDPSTVFNAPNSGALGDPNYLAAAATPGAYLDMAAPITQFRVRYDDALNNKFPDRGEYFYAQCGCFRQLNIDPKAQGPGGANNSVSYQDARAYGEYAFSSRVSVFAEVPFEWINYNTVGNGTINAGGLTSTSPGNAGGLADMNAGFKYAFIAQPKEYLTFQLRTYIPTGDSYEGLGTAHVSIEPSLLYYRRVADRWNIQGQLTEWTPIGVTGFASQVVQYGAGVGYSMWQSGAVVVTPTFETVGWTFIGGKEFNPSLSGPVSASGDTVVNIKPGVRIGFGNVNAPAGQQRQSLYFGWGHAVTSQQFYQDIYRVEYRILF